MDERVFVGQERATTTIPTQAGQARWKLTASQISSATIIRCMARAISRARAMPNFFGMEWRPAALSNSTSWQA